MTLLQFRMTKTLQRWIVAKLPMTLLVLLAVSLLMTVYFLNAWWVAYQQNQSFENKTLVKQLLSPTEYLKAYCVGYLLVNQQKPIEAAKAFAIAEVSQDPALSMRAKYALANIHFEAAIASIDIEHGGSHRRAVERILMAREGYKSVLRMQPNFYDARYNLELIDRLSPEKRTEGYENSPDGTIGLQPYQQNGTALMKDNTRRGLP